MGLFDRLFGKKEKKTFYCTKCGQPFEGYNKGLCPKCAGAVIDAERFRKEADAAAQPKKFSKPGPPF